MWGMFLSNSSPIRFAEKIICKGRNVLKDMVPYSELQGLPESDECWKHMIGDQIEHNKKDFFLEIHGDASHCLWCYTLQNWWCI